ncbi:hypothetical protein NDU88_011596 [Pleurodeles waltl]|uniref:Uncharacterized protein n=1 Tax=Pleurodeles waltl TaxID=8319 RepID=A0AAV7S1M8_PLEWA|nr:hypothetical protein NDU88_011596 [Pleurodeles waltl]
MMIVPITKGQPHGLLERLSGFQPARLRGTAHDVEQRSACRPALVRHIPEALPRAAFLTTAVITLGSTATTSVPKSH